MATIVTIVVVTVMYGDFSTTSARRHPPAELQVRFTSGGRGDVDT